ncbi:MAG TPA: sulfotransferase, partial [Steroidobacteraceae bacterium]|nr:sulfotransferase [Steroidobacteraceae bacterium]
MDIALIRVAALLESDPPAAARAAQELVRKHPGHPAAVLLLGTARRRSGDPQAAAAAFAELAASQPESASVQLELARSLLALHRPTEAFTALSRALALEPDLAEGWRELSGLHAARQEWHACDSTYARFAELTHQDDRLSEAATAIAQERLEHAAALLRQEIARQPQDVVALRLLAQVAAKREDFVEAERLLEECLRLEPGYSRARFDLAEILLTQQKPEPMLPLLERLRTFDPRDVNYRTLEAAAYGMLGRSERAVSILAEVVREFPENASGWMFYGHALRYAGRTDQAIDAYRRSLHFRPQFGEVWYSLANLKTFRFTPADVAAMREQLTRADLTAEDRWHFEFALGQALEHAGDFPGSFEHYARGNALRRSVIPYDPDRNTQLIARTRALFTREFFEARKGSGSTSAEPIFIVGMPRAGSTLLEQVLASHSQVEGTRELPDMAAFARELGAWDDEPVYPASVASLSRAQLAALGERYLRQTRPHRLLGRPHFVDKMGNNFLDIGLIHLIFPNARIIDARRGALACCFSNFKQHFQSGVWFCYSLEDLGRYYRDYVGLMAHFDAVLPGRIYRVQYEDLVADFESGVRRLLEHCGLPFEEQCLRFHETRRVVQTASSEQVRRPLYSDSVDEWRNYEPWLGAL